MKKSVEIHRPVSVAVITTDSDSVDRGSIPSRAFFVFLLFLMGQVQGGGPRKQWVIRRGWSVVRDAAGCVSVVRAETVIT